jgi:sugar O-acyltransferase (sialic acid O-acetyltransferase NeuD family)
LRVVIVGAGGHGQVVRDILQAASRTDRALDLVGYVDDGWESKPAALSGVRILGPVSALAEIGYDRLVIAVGDNAARARLFHALAPAALATAIHPTAIVAEDAAIGGGSMVVAGAIVNTGSSVGRSVILNTGCSLDHHSTVADFAHLAPGVRTGGEVEVGEGAFIGIGAVVLPQVRIGAWSVVGAGAVVLRDVPDGATVAGNPARPIRRRVPGSR